MVDSGVGVQATGLHPADIVVIVLYFVGTFAVAIYTIFKAKTNIKDFFLAGRSMVWWPVGMSLFASNIGCTNFVGIAGSGAASGLAVVHFEWGAVWLLMLLGWIFVPVYIASGIYTMPEYLYWRFGGQRIRIYLAVVSLLTYLLAITASDLYSGAIFLQQTWGWPVFGGAAFLLAIAFLFTALGGLETVILTDALAVFVMIIGGIVLSILGFIQVGGYDNMKYRYMRSLPNYTIATYPNTTCGFPRDDAFHIFREAWGTDYPWLGVLLRTSFGSLWYWCANQVLVQRALAAKNLNHVKGGCLFAGYLKLTPMFIMVLPGMISRVMFPDEVACVDPEVCRRVCDNPAGCSNIALPKLVMEVLPAGVRGFLISAMIAAVISSLTSIFNSSSALFTMDIWTRFRKQPTQRELLFVGRMWVVVMAGSSFLLIPVMSQSNGAQIFVYATNINGILGAPTCAMFLFAMFWKRCNEKGAFWGLMVSIAWGLTKFIVDMVFPAPRCGEVDDRPWFASDWHVYYHTATEILLAFAVAIVVSLCTEKPSNEKIAGLTYWTRFQKPHRDEVAEKLRDEEEKNAVQKAKEIEPEVEESYAHNLRTRLLNALCGSNAKLENTETSYDIVEEHSSRIASLKQTVGWRNFMNVNAVILGVVTVFLYGFFH